MYSCSIVSREWKPNIKTVLTTICLIFIFLVSTNTVGAIASPDLIIQTIETDKTTLDPGESFEIQTRVWNQGTAVSGATTLRYYLSTDDTISTADTEVGSDGVDPLSSRGASAVRRRSDLSQTLTAPDTPGVHYYGVCIGALTDEADTTNNCSQAIAITVEAPPPDPVESAEPEPIVRPEAPDLVINSGRVDRSTIKQGQGVRLHITLTNRGMRAAPATTIRFYRSLDATISPEEDTELRAVPVGGLGPGSSYTTWALLPSPFAVGVFYYGACLDAVASEFDTTNNCSDAIEITTEAPGKPLLVVIGSISRQVLWVGGPPQTLNVSGHFVGKVETWTASSSKPSVVIASMSDSRVILTPVGTGWAVVTIKAVSGELATKLAFSVSVGGVALPEPTVRDTIVPGIPDISGPDTSPEVLIPDANLRAAVQSALGLAGGVPITQQKMQGLITLYAGQRGIADLTGLEHATYLGYLSLERNSISDISVLSGLINLTSLSLADNSISDISVLSRLTNLRSLDLHRNSISNISAVSGLTNLTGLDLANNNISDISVLSGLTNLTSLELANNNISDISAVSGLTNLTGLWIYNNSISDISAVSGLTSLRSLSIWTNSISDVTPLENLTELTNLSLSGNPIEDLAPLRRLKEKNPSVQIDIAISADLNNAPPDTPFTPPPDTSPEVSIPDDNLRQAIRSALGLAEGDTITQQKMAGLTSLSAPQSKLSDLTGLEHATNLTQLWLIGNSISDISVLSGLTNLTHLELANNSISDISAVAGLTNLTFLGVYFNNSIIDISAVAGLTNLTFLVFLDNSIIDISAVAGLTNLTELWLSGNNISDISAVAGLTNLTTLYLTDNSISDISAVSGLTNLTELWIWGNSISDVTPLENLTALTSLKLTGNPIADLAPLRRLKEKNPSVQIDLNINADLYNIPPSPPVTSPPDTSPEVSIPDANLRAVVRSVLGLSEGDTITQQEMQRLISLHASSRGIADLTSLEHATNLTVLDLGSNSISDISAVAGLTNLTFLGVYNNSIIDISAVAGLINLTELWIYDNSISDISAVAGLTNLTELWIYDNSISDISAVAGLTNLTELWLSGNNINDISAVAGLTNLTELWLSGNNINDISAVAGLTNLTTLYLSGNPITDLAPLRRLKENNPGVYIDIDINAGQAPSLPVLPLIPVETALFPNYPNPFNPETWIPYQLAEATDVTVTIYDISGTEVQRWALGHQPAGVYYNRGRAAHWDGRNQIGEKVATGLYFYTLTAGEFTATGKMLIQK